MECHSLVASELSGHVPEFLERCDWQLCKSWTLDWENEKKERKKERAANQKTEAAVLLNLLYYIYIYLLNQCSLHFKLKFLVFAFQRSHFGFKFLLKACDSTSHSWSSCFTPKFLAVRVNAKFSMFKEMSLMRDSFPGRKSSSVLSRLSFRWCADIHWGTSVRHAEICAATRMSEKEKDRISLFIIQRYC